MSKEFKRRGPQTNILCECDSCGALYEYESDGTPSFKLCQEEIKSEGWISRKVDGDWYDFCSVKCSIDFSNERKKQA